MDSPEKPAVSSTTPTSTGFTVRSYDALFPSTGTLGYAVWPGARIACSQSIPPNFYAPHVNVGPFIPLLPLLPPLWCHAMSSVLPSLPPLPIWMNMTSLNPWLLDFHTVHFSGSSSCFLFCFVLKLVVILLMVEQGGKACLPMPPS